MKPSYDWVKRRNKFFQDQNDYFNKLADDEDSEVIWLERMESTLHTTATAIEKFIENKRNLNGFTQTAIADSSHWHIGIYENRTKEGYINMSGFVIFAMRDGVEDGIPKIVAMINKSLEALNMNKCRFGPNFPTKSISTKCPDNEFTLESGLEINVGELILWWNESAEDSHKYGDGKVILIKFQAMCATTILWRKTSCRDWLNIAGDFAEKIAMRVIKAVVNLADMSLDDVELQVINKKVSFP